MARKKKEEALKPEDKKEMLEMRFSGVPPSVIAKKFQTSRQAAWEIVRSLPSPNGKETVDLDLFGIISNLRMPESQWRSVVPSSMVVPVPSWVALEIARSLYRQGLLSRQDYEKMKIKYSR
jgi:hypothetical protein